MNRNPSAPETIDIETAPGMVRKGIPVCRSFAARLRGFLFRSGLTAGDALFIPDCFCIHTFLMTRSLRVLFLDKNMRVVKEIPHLRPYRVACCLKARHVVEIIC